MQIQISENLAEPRFLANASVAATAAVAPVPFPALSAAAPGVAVAVRPTELRSAPCLRWHCPWQSSTRRTVSGWKAGERGSLQELWVEKRMMPAADDRHSREDYGYVLPSPPQPRSRCQWPQHCALPPG
ncbi:hypothetical protein Vafri_9541, partial [Volvox africanus]